MCCFMFFRTQVRISKEEGKDPAGYVDRAPSPHACVCVKNHFRFACPCRKRLRSGLLNLFEIVANSLAAEPPEPLFDVDTHPKEWPPEQVSHAPPAPQASNPLLSFLLCLSFMPFKSLLHGSLDRCGYGFSPVRSSSYMESA